MGAGDDKAVADLDHAGLTGDAVDLHKAIIAGPHHAEGTTRRSRNRGVTQAAQTGGKKGG